MTVPEHRWRVRFSKLLVSHSPPLPPPWLTYLREHTSHPPMHGMEKKCKERQRRYVIISMHSHTQTHTHPLSNTHTHAHPLSNTHTHPLSHTLSYLSGECNDSLSDDDGSVTQTMTLINLLCLYRQSYCIKSC